MLSVETDKPEEQPQEDITIDGVSVSEDEANGTIDDVSISDHQDIRPSVGACQGHELDFEKILDATELEQAQKKAIAEINLSQTQCNERIQDAEDSIDEAEATIAAAKREIKESEAIVEGETIVLRRLLRELAQAQKGILKPKRSPAQETAEAEETSTSEPEDNSWRDHPTEAILKGIPGVGKKKVEALLAIAPNAGKLEDLRGEASRECLHFSKVLPKGFGEGAADAIENRLIDVIAQCGPSAQEQADKEKNDGNEDKPGTSSSDVPSNGGSTSGKGTTSSPPDDSDSGPDLQRTTDEVDSAGGPASPAHQPADGEEYETVD